MITIDRRALLQELIAAVREAPPETRAELRRALDDADRPVERYLTAAAFAAARSLGVSTVRGYIRDGRLQAIKIGRSVRIAADAMIGPASGSPKNLEAADGRAERRLGLVRGGRS